MKKIMTSIIIALLAVCSVFSKDLFTENGQNNSSLEINNFDAKFLRVTDNDIDTLSVYDLLPKHGLSLICFSENWCDPSYKEFNRLYNDSIVDYLKLKDIRLIVLAAQYPFLNINRLDTLARNRIEQDFEIYYYANHSDGHIVSFPCIWLVDSLKRVIYHSVGLQDDYGQIKNRIETSINKHCPRCDGTGKVEPNRHSDPDESVGICRMCGGSGRINGIIM